MAGSPAAGAAVHVRPELVGASVPAAGTGRTLRNLAPESSSIEERYTEKQRKQRCVARNWPVP
jgi:hypothetical protein